MRKKKSIRAFGDFIIMFYLSLVTSFKTYFDKTLDFVIQNIEFYPTKPQVLLPITKKHGTQYLFFCKTETQLYSTHGLFLIVQRFYF